jgi:hypothetical protein
VKLVPISIMACDGGDCPAAFRTDRGTIIIRGQILDDAARRLVITGEKEVAVEIPQNFLKEICCQA